MIFRGVCYFIANRLTAESQNGVIQKRYYENHVVLFANFNGVNTFKQGLRNRNAFFGYLSLHTHSILQAEWKRA